MTLFNGRYTVSGPRGHRVFRVRTQKADAKFLPGVRLVQVDEGETNDWGSTKWASIGRIIDGRIVLFSTKQGYGPQVAVINALLQTETGEVTHPSGARYTMQVERQCARCNRALTHPESLVTGLGPECAGKVGYSGGTSAVVPAAARV